MSTRESVPDALSGRDWASTEADGTARRLLDAAVERFASQGIRRTTMDEIARTAGVARATLYRHVTTREELVQAVLDRELGRFLGAAEARVEHLQDPRERVLEGLVSMLLVARGHPLLSRLAQLEPDLILPLLTVRAGPTLQRNQRRLARHLRAAQRQGVVRDDVDPGTVAELLARLCQSLLLTPDGLLEGHDEAGLRRFVRAYVAPALVSDPACPDAAGPHDT